jgi:hypothetical protein
MTDHPRIGELAPEWQIGLCSYAPDEDSVACLAEAKWHGVAIVGGERQGLGGCDGHKPIMAGLVDYIHPMEPACDLPGAWFIADENRCVLPWDDTRALAAEETAEAL